MVDRSHILLHGLLCYGFVLVARAADTGYLRTTIETRFSENRHHSVNPNYKLAAQEFIEAEFTRFGLQVVKPPINGDPAVDVLKGRTFTNVIGILKGSRFGKAHDAITAIGAHYDTNKRSSGVDYNGSGVAAMLETARRLTSEYRKPKNTVIFAAFDIEEYLFHTDKIGSQQLVTVWLPAWLQQNYGTGVTDGEPKFKGIIILDTVMNYDSSNNSQNIYDVEAEFQKEFPTAYEHIKSDNFRGDFLAVISRASKGDAHLASGLQRSWEECDRPEFEIESFELQITNLDLKDKKFKDFLRSDHYHFWKKDLNAIFITDTADQRGWMEQCYHEACDNRQLMLTDTNVAYLGKVSDAMTDLVGKLSGATHLTSATPASAVPSLRYSAFTLALLVLWSLL